MSLSAKQRDFSLALGHFLVWINTYTEYEVTLGEAYRTQEQQDLYLKTGKSKKKYSKHQYRLAQDLNLYKDGKYCTDKEEYRTLGEKWESMGGIWGGRYGVKKNEYTTKVGWDSNHFEWHR